MDTKRTHSPCKIPLVFLETETRHERDSNLSLTSPDKNKLSDLDNTRDCRTLGVMTVYSCPAPHRVRTGEPQPRITTVQPPQTGNVIQRGECDLPLLVSKHTPNSLNYIGLVNLTTRRMSLLRLDE